MYHKIHVFMYMYMYAGVCHCKDILYICIVSKGDLTFGVNTRMGVQWTECDVYVPYEYSLNMYICNNQPNMLNCLCLIQGALGTPGDDILQRASEEVLPLYIFCYKTIVINKKEKMDTYFGSIVGMPPTFIFPRSLSVCISV